MLALREIIEQRVRGEIQKIAFVSERDGNREIYVMNTEGSEQIRLTDNPAHDNMSSWSPDM